MRLTGFAVRAARRKEKAWPNRSCVRVARALDRYDIQPQFQSTLDQVAQTLSSYDQTYIDVLGHTDSTGSDAYNQALSQRRAQSVSDYLAGHGVALARIGTRGYGESQPIASNDTDPGRAENRRVEIKVVPVTQPGY
jgi:outer membrane protein OmpA-like peptidoglycan-associated protein